MSLIKGKGRRHEGKNYNGIMNMGFNFFTITKIHMYI